MSALQAFYKVKYRPVSMACLWLLNRSFVIKTYSICAGVSKVRTLTSVIFYCFESSVCSHFVIWSASLLTSLFNSLIQCCSSIFLSLRAFAFILFLQSLVSPYIVLLSKALLVLSDLMCFWFFYSRKLFIFIPFFYHCMLLAIIYFLFWSEITKLNLSLVILPGCSKGG